MSANLEENYLPLSPLAEAHRIARLLNLPEGNPSFSFKSPPAMSLADVACCLVKGDNLDVLGLLSSDYAASIDFCYIDPPYNTGTNFIYDDKRHSPDSGIWGKHAAWMGFMLPRLVLMRCLLADFGIAAISIDDYEYANLRILLDHVFGIENHLGTLIVHRSKNGKGSKAHIAVSHEYVLVYGKSASAQILGLPELDLVSYDKQDEHGRYKIDGLFRKKGEASRREDRPNMFYPLYYDSSGNVFTERIASNLKEVFPLDSQGVERRWLWGPDKARVEAWKLYASPKGIVYVKNYLTDEKRIKVRSLWDSPRYLTERGTNEVSAIFGERVFETPKPLGLIEDLLKCCSKKDALVLDFFAGTATTAHAAFNVNREDGGTRKVLLVEQQAQIDSVHPAALKGFRYIADIAEHRLAHLAAQDDTYRYKVVEF